MSSQNIYVLGIESSCDDTAASVIHNGKVLSNVVANQKIHEAYGGVVPELASRAHSPTKYSSSSASSIAKGSNVTKEQLSAVAFTRVIQV
ncbi:MAG: hypothetical protein R2816_11520 [Flavobacteriaceae bacterium]